VGDNAYPAIPERVARALAPVALSLSLAVGCASASSGSPSGPTDRAAIKRLVAEEAVRMKVPPSLALAVAHAESNFNPRARSRKDARGVMQIMPATARHEYAIDPHLLWNPRINVRVGLHFLRRLIDQYDGRVDLALSYYNGGSAVGRLPNARVLPATRRYVSKVLRLWSAYRRVVSSGEV